MKPSDIIEECALEAADWFTLPPNSRTKAKLLEKIRSVGDRVNAK